MLGFTFYQYTDQQGPGGKLDDSCAADGSRGQRRPGLEESPARRPESLAQWRRFLYTFNLMMPGQGAARCRAGRVKAERNRRSLDRPTRRCRRYSHELLLGLPVLSCRADAAARSRVILAFPSTKPDAWRDTCSSQPSARSLDLAAWRPQERLALHVPHATRAIP